MLRWHMGVISGVMLEYEFTGYSWVIRVGSIFWVLRGALYGLGNCFMAEEKKKKSNTDMRV